MTRKAALLPTAPETARFTLDYTGPIVSLNDYRKLSGVNLWRKLKPIETHFAVLVLQVRPPKLQAMRLTVRHNTKLDLDNVTGMIKPCVDVLRRQGIVPDDCQGIWDSLTIAHDPKLTKGMVRFEVEGVRK